MRESIWSVSYPTKGVPYLHLMNISLLYVQTLALLFQSGRAGNLVLSGSCKVFADDISLFS
jgi:hypothetical protein